MPVPLICTLVAAVVFFLLALWNMKSMVNNGMRGFVDIDKYFGRNIVFGGLFALSSISSAVLLIIWLVKGHL